jgi:transcriptional regulator with XRE-family HTH domain
MPAKIPNPTDKHVGSRVRMRRLVLDMSQTDIADALGLTFQQVQKYEKGTNRIGASRLQHISQVLQVPVPFFFEGAPAVSGVRPGHGTANAPSPSYMTDFLATSDGLSLAKAFMLIEDPKLRRAIVRLVEERPELVRLPAQTTPRPHRAAGTPPDSSPVRSCRP